MIVNLVNRIELYKIAQRLLKKIHITSKHYD